MSLQQDDATTPDQQEQQVADYLIQHPDFLASNPEVLAAQQIPHSAGSATSLIERQVQVLREQSTHYRRQLEELIEVARENDQLNGRLHRLTLALMEAASLDEVLNVLQDELRDKFKADAVELKLFQAEELAEQADKGEPGANLFRDFITSGRPSCGELDDARLAYLFGSAATDTASVAIVPLTDNQVSGVLAIGSHDADRFHSGQGLDFLRRLGEVVGRALQNVIAPGV